MRFNCLLDCATKNIIRTGLPTWLALVVLGIWPWTARAHVELNSPNGGETLAGGSSFSIQWMPAVAQHDTLNFDLWYSTVASDGPWNVIVANLPAGDLSVGSLHTHSWTVPNIVDASVWVRVRQDNDVNQDYEDVSSGSFSITAPTLPGDYNNDGTVNAADYVEWRKGAAPLQAEYNTWHANFGRTAPGSGAGASAAVPQPSSSLLLLLGSVSILALRRRQTTHSLKAGG